MDQSNVREVLATVRLDMMYFIGKTKEITNINLQSTTTMLQSIVIVGLTRVRREMLGLHFHIPPSATAYTRIDGRATGAWAPGHVCLTSHHYLPSISVKLKLLQNYRSI